MDDMTAEGKKGGLFSFEQVSVVVARLVKLLY